MLKGKEDDRKKKLREEEPHVTGCGMADNLQGEWQITFKNSRVADSV
jgi:hypothetical protein